MVLFLCIEVVACSWALVWQNWLEIRALTDWCQKGFLLLKQILLHLYIIPRNLNKFHSYSKDRTGNGAPFFEKMYFFPFIIFIILKAAAIFGFSLAFTGVKDQYNKLFTFITFTYLLKSFSSLDKHACTFPRNGVFGYGWGHKEIKI